MFSSFYKHHYIFIICLTEGASSTPSSAYNSSHEKEIASQVGSQTHGIQMSILDNRLLLL